MQWPCPTDLPETCGEQRQQVNPRLQRRSFQERNIFSDLALTIARTWDQAPSDARELLLRGFALQLVARLLAPSKTTVEATTAQRIRDLMTWMRFHLHRTVTRSELSQRAGLGQTALGKAFRKHVGLAPLAWFEIERLEEARRRICTSRQRIADIAAQCGFTDPAYFSRRYRNRFGLGPREHRSKKEE